MRRAIGLLLKNAPVGYISFGTQIQVHELDFFDMFKVLISQELDLHFFSYENYYKKGVES